MEEKKVGLVGDKFVGDTLTEKVISQHIISVDIREIDVYMIVKYYVYCSIEDKYTTSKIMDYLKSMTTDVVRKVMTNLVIKYGLSFKFPSDINKIPEDYNMFISDTTERLIAEFVKENIVGQLASGKLPSNEGDASRYDA